MRYLNHKNNKAGWQAKQGDASPAEVAAFAAQYCKILKDEGWAVSVMEGAGWIACGHIRSVIAYIRAAGVLSVWISDGTNAQCIWRKREG